MSLPAKNKAVDALIDLVVTNFTSPNQFNMGHIAGTLPGLIKARINYDDPVIDVVLMRAHQIIHEYEGCK